MTRVPSQIEVAEAVALLHCQLPDWGTVTCRVEDALGQVLRNRVTAERDQPPFDRVTMDGIAICHRGYGAAGGVFQTVGTQGAGSPPLPLPDGASGVIIMTGAALPPGADTVIPLERFTLQGTRVTVEAGYTPSKGQFIHRQGADNRQGDALLGPGSWLGPPEMGILTVSGADTVQVARRPRVALISTGDELVAAGQPLGPAQIRGSNGPSLSAVLHRRGFTPCTQRHLPDNRAVLERELGQLLAGQDVLILTGGVSAGAFDFVPGVLADLGVTPVFHKVLQRPGRPLWFGRSPGGQPVFALPGNPVASLVCGVRYVMPLLLAALGAAPRPARVVQLSAAVHFSPDLTYFLPVRLAYTPGGQCLAEPHPTNTSGDFIALGGTDGFVELPRGKADFPAGYPARFFPW